MKRMLSQYSTQHIQKQIPTKQQTKYRGKNG